MLSEQQKQQIQARGIAVETFETQLENFKKGFPYLNIEAAATPAKGIKVLSEDEQAKYIASADKYAGNVCKFVPASGAATRMFKDLFEAADKLAAGEKLKEGSPAAKFVENITLFPFFDAKALADGLGIDKETIDATVNEFPSLEHINNSRETAPSKRLEKWHPQYGKTTTGIAIAKTIPVDTMRAKCPLFNQWLSAIEAVAGV